MSIRHVQEESSKQLPFESLHTDFHLDADPIHRVSESSHSYVRGARLTCERAARASFRLAKGNDDQK